MTFLDRLLSFFSRKASKDTVPQFPANTRKASLLVIHASDTPITWMAKAPTSAKVAEIRRWHTQDRGWSDIGYHLVIDRDGTVATGRPMGKIGAHVSGHNPGSIGVCLIGGMGYDRYSHPLDTYTHEQLLSLAKVIKYYSIGYCGHHDLNIYKKCPCMNLHMFWKIYLQ